MQTSSSVAQNDDVQDLVAELRGIFFPGIFRTNPASASASTALRSAPFFIQLGLSS